MKIIEDEMLDIENIEFKDKVAEKELQNINGANLFLALIEPKKFATEEVIDFCNTNLTREGIKEILDSSLDEIKKRDLNLYFSVLDDLDKRGIENVITELQIEYFERLQNYKEERKIVTTSILTFLTIIKDKIYDFIDNSYLDLNEYYINYAEPFKKYFNEEDWQIEYFKHQQLAKISFNNGMDFLIDLFWKENNDKIDKNAKNKIMKLEY